MEKDYLIIEGARQNNLKSISLSIPHNKITVITGVSGSGKSSLAFDTIFAEGQWRYIESLSTYARMFLKKLDRPDVDAIHNIRPAIAIEQKNPVRTSRSTVGTATEVYDYLRLLFAKIGKTYCLRCNVEAKSIEPSQIVENLLKEYEGGRALIMFPIPVDKSPEELMRNLLQKGFHRIKVGEEVIEIAPETRLRIKGEELLVVLDRLIIKDQDRTRLADSVEMAFKEGEGSVAVEVIEKATLHFNLGFRCPGCGEAFEPPQPLLFSFNHPIGACPECKGFGNILKYDEDLIIPNKNLSLLQGAIDPWTKPAYRWWYRQLLSAAEDYDIDVNKPYAQLPKKIKKILFKGTADFEGIDDFFEYLEGKRYKLHVRVFLSRYRSPFSCTQCGGSRLKEKARMVKVAGLNIHQLCEMTIEESSDWFEKLSLTEFEKGVAEEVFHQIKMRLSFLLQVGLGYLTFNRLTRTLSGGEAQRINLANQLGSRLAGTIYVLDEPSIGLHARDTGRLINILKELVRTGNTLIVVEHDRAIIESADHIIELGPWGGEKGGDLVFTGGKDEFIKGTDTLTSRYLSGKVSIPLPSKRRKWSNRYLILTGAVENNLKGIELKIPLQTLTCITGVSGSGKSTLIHDTLYRALARVFRIEFQRTGRFDRLYGVEYLRGVRLIDQEPIGRSPRSNPVTYLKIFDEIRKIYAELPEARAKGFTPGSFSFNVPGGRCEACQGSGYQKLEMYFFEDIYATCEGCDGKRYKPEILKITYKGRDINHVLNMTMAEAVEFFEDHVSLQRKLWIPAKVGLGYLRLGQPATTLSGGEAQRLKICAELIGRHVKDYLYIFDEPTTGLHFDDIKKLLRVLHELVDAGNTVVVIEHHMDVIKTADYIIDLGPEGGDKGGEIIAQGTPEDVAEVEGSYTGRYLKEYLRVRV